MSLYYKTERGILMKVAGVILLVLQAISLLGSVANGDIGALFNFGRVREIGRLLGFFLPSIIGVVLLMKASKNNAEKEDTDK